MILKEEEIENFLNEYLKCVRARFDITGLKRTNESIYGDYMLKRNHLVRNGMGAVSAAG